LLAGCAHGVREQWDDLCLSLRNRRHAARAWDRTETIYDRVQFAGHFEEGFKAGYLAVAEGGNGCPPTLPPRRYWKARHRSPEGHRKARAWFDGFAHGAVAADQDGIAHWNRIPVSQAALAGASVLHYEEVHPPIMTPIPQFPNPPEPILPPPAPPADSQHSGM
jgi:hypothetical protein